jgi:hypothetical protein
LLRSSWREKGIEREVREVEGQGLSLQAWERCQQTAQMVIQIQLKNDNNLIQIVMTAFSVYSTSPVSYFLLR